MYQKIFCLSTNLLCSKKSMENKISIIVEKWWETYVKCQLLICNHPFVRCGKINGDICNKYVRNVYLFFDTLIIIVQ
jgi:hypothetical protein